MVDNNPITLSDLMGLMRRNSFTSTTRTTENIQQNNAAKQTLPPAKTFENRIYNFVDPRSEEGAVRQKVVSSFTFPTPTSSESISYYLKKSIPGNSFVGIMHIRTGELHIYPLAAEREEANASIWAKEYTGETLDNGKPITHAAFIGGNSITSHDQLVNKISGKRENYVGFAINNLRHIRGYEHGGFLGVLDYNTSGLYGRSRTLNTSHFKSISEEGISYETDKETYEKNKGEFIFELPIELKLKIITSIVNSLGENHEISKFLSSELLGSELNKNYKPAPKFWV
jgi:hypothetical protein